jgi:hypothetical protein
VDLADRDRRLTHAESIVRDLAVGGVGGVASTYVDTSGK